MLKLRIQVTQEYFSLITILDFVFCFRGFQVMKIRVTKGSPLPFAFEMLTLVMTYGSKPFVQHPADIPDYYKQAVENGGLSWERIVTFEDGAVMTVCNQST